MSTIFEVKTLSSNGLPLLTLLKAMQAKSVTLIEAISWERQDKDGNVYTVQAHESVNPTIEIAGR